MAESKNSGYAIASLVFGIVSLIFGLIPFIGIIFVILALVFGFVALRKIKEDPSLEGKGMAIAGIIMGFIGVIFVFFSVFIATIAYFGVLSPSQFVSDRCIVGSPLTCDNEEYALTTSYLEAQVRQGLSQTMTITEMNYRIGGEEGVCTNINEDSPLIIAPNEDTLLRCDFEPSHRNILDRGNQQRATFDMLYNTGGQDYNRRTQGEIYARVS